MKNKTVFIPDKRKYLFCADQKGILLLKPVLEQTKLVGAQLEIISFEENQQILYEKLSRQKVGSFLYAALSWEKLFSFQQLIEEIGFTSDEVQLIGHGVQSVKIFCCRCHGITEAAQDEKEITCKHCHLNLALSDHFSRLKDAYLGYVAKL